MSLLVYCAGKRAGTLDMAPGERFYGYSYDPAYLAGEALSLSLPLRETRFSGAESLPFFEGLLPEGSVRDRIARQLHISSTSPPSSSAPWGMTALAS
jgi:serine/threonine-protein kinase HipA